MYTSWVNASLKLESGCIQRGRYSRYIKIYAFFYSENNVFVVEKWSLLNRYDERYRYRDRRLVSQAKSSHDFFAILKKVKDFSL